MGYHQYTWVYEVLDMSMSFMPDDLVSMGVLSGDVGDHANDVSAAREGKKIYNEYKTELRVRRWHIFFVIAQMRNESTSTWSFPYPR
jgi:hypothetical protein